MVRRDDSPGYSVSRRDGRFREMTGTRLFILGLVSTADDKCLPFCR